MMDKAVIFVVEGKTDKTALENILVYILIGIRFYK